MIWPVQESLQPMELGESGKVRIGQQVLAIGNPFGFDHTLTTGLPSSCLLSDAAHLYAQYPDQRYAML